MRRALGYSAAGAGSGTWSWRAARGHDGIERLCYLHEVKLDRALRLVVVVGCVTSVVACKEALGPAAAIATDLALAAAAEGIRAAMEPGHEKVDPIMPDDTGQRRLVTHPLINLVATRSDGVIGATELARAMRSRDVVWLALRYDDPDQWRTVARVVSAIAELGSKPTILFDAVPADEGAALRGSSAGALADTLPWPRYGIETPAMLGPLLSVIDQKKLSIDAAGASPSELRTFAQLGASAATTERGRQIALDGVWPVSRTAALQAVLERERCGPLPAEVAASMLTLERARAGALARNVLAAAAQPGATPRVLVLTELRRGRNDFGGPRALGELASREGRSVTSYSLGFFGVEETRTDIEEYDAELASYDAGWFTPSLPPRCAISP